MRDRPTHALSNTLYVPPFLEGVEDTTNSMYRCIPYLSLRMGNPVSGQVVEVVWMSVVLWARVSAGRPMS